LKYIAIYLITISLSVYFGVYMSAICFDIFSGADAEHIIHQDLQRVLQWVTYSAANYGLSISVILAIRFIEWSFVEKERKSGDVYLLTYCWTFLIAFFVGPLGLVLAAKYFQVPQYVNIGLLDAMAGTLKWGIGPAIIAVFISYYMDRQTSSALPDIRQSRDSILWRIALSFGVALVTMVLLFLPLVSIKATDPAIWSTEKLQAVAAGTTFLLSFSLAMVAQFALRK
jgi:hypothetical protein